MNTKIMIAVTVAAFSLATTAFAAGEGGNDRLQAPAPQFQAAASGWSADTGSQQYPAPNPALSVAPFGEPTLPENGQNGPVQTANSLPVGFENGTAAYQYAQSVNRFFAQQADHRFAQSHPAISPRG